MFLYGNVRLKVSFKSAIIEVNQSLAALVLRYSALVCISQNPGKIFMTFKGRLVAYKSPKNFPLKRRDDSKEFSLRQCDYDQHFLAFALISISINSLDSGSSFFFEWLSKILVDSYSTTYVLYVKV